MFKDVDISMKIEDYDENLFKTFLGNKNMMITVQYGFPDDSLEFTLLNKFFQYDVFFVYKLNSTHNFYGYHYRGLKFKQIIINTDSLCSAELINIKVKAYKRFNVYLNFHFKIKRLLYHATLLSI